MNKTKQKYKKPVAIGMLIAVAVAIVGGIWMYLDSLPDDAPDTVTVETVPVQYVYDADGYHRPSFWDPDWETDIFTLQRYLDKNRYITFKDGGVSIMMIDGEYDEYGVCVKFLADYIETLTKGDAESLNRYYSEAWLEANGRYEAFTMQKIYDAVIELIVSEDSVKNGMAVTQYVYKLSYKILENDGTFRSDVESDASRPQFFYVLDDGNSMYITDVTYSLK